MSPGSYLIFCIIRPNERSGGGPDRTRKEGRIHREEEGSIARQEGSIGRRRVRSHAKRGEERSRGGGSHRIGHVKRGGFDSTGSNFFWKQRIVLGETFDGKRGETRESSFFAKNDHSRFFFFPVHRRDGIKNRTGSKERIVLASFEQHQQHQRPDDR